MQARIDRQGIEAAYATIRPYVRVTPVVELDGADLGLAPFSLSLKLEHLQVAGSFKTRGAFAHLLSRNVPAAGVVAASGGNHGTAVAYAARRLGVRARIFVPRVASPAVAADSLAPRRVGEIMFPIARAFVDRVVLVSDAAIEEGQRALWDALRVVAEPGGAAAFSALHCGAYRPAPGERVGAIVSGGNTTAVSFGGPAAGESGRKAPPP